MRSSSAIRRASMPALLGIVLCALSVQVYRAESAGQLSLDIEAGQILEMTMDTAIPRPEMNWIFTRDRQFVTAQRGRFFSTRQTVVGMYLLDVAAQDIESRQSEYQAFIVNVKPVSGTQSLPPPSQNLQAVLTATPSNGGIIMLPEQGGIAKIEMGDSTGQISEYRLDLDSSVDSDGDGNPENDRDNAGTVGERDGNPLFVYLRPTTSARRILLTVTGTDGQQTSTAALQVMFSNQPVISSSNQSQMPGSSGLIAYQADGLRVTFGARIDPQVSANKQLLLEWDFGDEGRSLLDSPTHSFQAPGIYTVTLAVRDIATGQAVTSGQQAIQVQGSVNTSSTSSSVSSVSSISSSQSAQSSGGSGFGIGSIVYVGFIVVILLAIALALFFLLKWLKNKTTGKLQESLEKMEDNLMKKPQEQAEQQASEPMKLKKEKKEEPPQDILATETQAIADRETSQSEFQSASDRDFSTPGASAGPVPPWLAKAEQKSFEPQAAPAQPAPEQVTQIQPPAATAAEEDPLKDSMPDWLKPQAPSATMPASEIPATPPQLDANQQTDSVPDWLKPAAAEPSVPVTPQSEVVPAAKSEPAASIVPETPNDAPIPDWLKPTTEKAADAPISVDQPAVTPSADSAAPKVELQPAIPTSSSAPVQELKKDNMPAQQTKQNAKKPQQQGLNKNNMQQKKEENAQKTQGKTEKTKPEAKEIPPAATPSPSATPTSTSEDSTIAIVQADSISEDQKPK